MKYLILFLFCFQKIFSAQEIEEDLLPKDETVLFVSLGSHCEPAIQMNFHKVRKRAFPFDWTFVSGHDNFIKILKEDFQNFFLPENLTLSKEYGWIINDSYYHMDFRHEFEDPAAEITDAVYLEVLEKSKEKFQKRINRFRQLKHFEGKVIFFKMANSFDPKHNVWHSYYEPEITSSQAVELRDALKEYFPGLNFLLVIINYNIRASESIEGFEDILEVRVDDQVTHENDAFDQLFNYLDSTYFLLVKEISLTF